MNARIHNCYVHLVGACLFLMATFSAVGAGSLPPLLGGVDPLLKINSQIVFIVFAISGLGLSAYVCLGRSSWMKYMLVAWLAAMLLAYRLGLWLIGASCLLDCVGNYCSWLPVGPRLAQAATLTTLGSMLVGSVVLLVLDGSPDRKTKSVESTGATLSQAV